MRLERQHVWLGPEATSFSETCEACLERKDYDTYGLAVVAIQVQGTLSLDVDVGFMTCARGHRIVVRRVGLTRKQRRRRTTAATG
jgi:hypothetical protein